jgi:hypothetical protein
VSIWIVHKCLIVPIVFFSTKETTIEFWTFPKKHWYCYLQYPCYQNVVTNVDTIFHIWKFENSSSETSSNVCLCVYKHKTSYPDEAADAILWNNGSENKSCPIYFDILLIAQYLYDTVCLLHFVYNSKMTQANSLWYRSSLVPSYTC